MGNQCARSLGDHDPAWPLTEHLQLQDEPIYLHLYDLGPGYTGQALNSILRPLGTPALHCGVEVLGHEWSYCFLTKDGDPYQGSGIFSSRPRQCDGHSYSQSIKLGYVPISKEFVRTVLSDMESDWRAIDYDIFSRNCCHFANELCARLGVGEFPAWVMRLTQVGRALAERQCVSAGALCCGRDGFDKHEALDDGGLCCCTTEDDPRGRLAPRVGLQRRADPWNDDVISAKSQMPNGIEEVPWVDGEWEHRTGEESVPVVLRSEYATPKRERSRDARTRSRGQDSLQLSRAIMINGTRR